MIDFEKFKDPSKLQEIADRLDNVIARIDNFGKPEEEKEPLPHPNLLPLPPVKHDRKIELKPPPKIVSERKTSHQLIIEKLGGVCVNCGGTDRLDKHHIVPLSRGGSDKLSNLTLLCRKCHSSIPKGSG